MRPAPGEAVVVYCRLANPLGRPASFSAAVALGDRPGLQTPPGGAEGSPGVSEAGAMGHFGRVGSRGCQDGGLHTADLRPVASEEELRVLQAAGCAQRGLRDAADGGGGSSSSGRGGQGSEEAACGELRFLGESSSRGGGGGDSVLLGAEEVAIIPFCLRLPLAPRQRGGTGPSPGWQPPGTADGGGGSSGSAAVEPHTVSVAFHAAGHSFPSAVTEVAVVPRRPTPDLTLRLRCGAGELMRAAVPLQVQLPSAQQHHKPQRLQGCGQGQSSDEPPRLTAACSDPSVAAAVAPAAGGGWVVRLRRKCGAAPEVRLVLWQQGESACASRPRARSCHVHPQLSGNIQQFT